MAGKRTSWNQQICTIENKGHQAFLDGVPATENPYTTGYHNQNGNGGSLQSQRRKAWRRGWEISKKESTKGT